MKPQPQPVCKLIVVSNIKTIVLKIFISIIPNLIIPPEEANITLGKWGMLYKSHLEKNKNVFFNTLLMQGKLYQHCAEIENQARDMFDTLVERTKEAEGVTEKLKEKNQMEWVCRIQNIEARVREIVVEELIYA